MTRTRSPPAALPSRTPSYTAVTKRPSPLRQATSYSRSSSSGSETCFPLSQTTSSSSYSHSSHAKTKAELSAIRIALADDDAATEKRKRFILLPSPDNSLMQDDTYETYETSRSRSTCSMKSLPSSLQPSIRISIRRRDSGTTTTTTTSFQSSSDSSGCPPHLKRRVISPSAEQQRPRASKASPPASSKPKKRVGSATHAAACASLPERQRQRHVSFLPPGINPGPKTPEELHPLLWFAPVRRFARFFDLPTPCSPFSFQYDISSPPRLYTITISRTLQDQITKTALRPDEIADILAEPATVPPTTSSLVLTCPKFPWEVLASSARTPLTRAEMRKEARGGLMTPNSSSSSILMVRHITNLDVLHAIHLTLAARVMPEEWETLSNAQKKRIARSYEERCIRTDGGWDEGVRRVDYLCGKTALVGIDFGKDGKDPKVEHSPSTVTGRAEVHEYIQEHIKVHGFVINYYKKRWNAHTVTCRLPTEILTAIFNQVGLQAKAATTDSTGLWSTIHAEFRTWAPQQLDRSNGVALSVISDNAIGKKTYAVLHQVLASPLHRVKNLVLGRLRSIDSSNEDDSHISLGDFRRLLQLLGRHDGPLRTVERLEMHSNMFSHDDHDIQFRLLPDNIFAETRCLRHLILAGYGLNWGLLHTFDSLKTFIISGIPGQFRPSIVAILPVPIITDAPLQQHSEAEPLDRAVQQWIQQMDHVTTGLVSQLNVSYTGVQCWKYKGGQRTSFRTQEPPVIELRPRISTRYNLMPAAVRSLRSDPLVSLVMDGYCEVDTWTCLGNLPHVAELKAISDPLPTIEALCRGVCSPQDEQSMAHTKPENAGAHPAFPALTALTISCWDFEPRENKKLDYGELLRILDPPPAQRSMIMEKFLNCIEQRAKAKLSLKLLRMEYCRSMEKKDVLEMREMIDTVYCDVFP
ncbi:hypothetical protein H0H92_005551 [Tricholoma furcatifolium]|nr:hypothetical protein H0H92_005551 [Tricholoma furcatifolium]